MKDQPHPGGQGAGGQGQECQRKMGRQEGGHGETRQQDPPPKRGGLPRGDGARRSDGDGGRGGGGGERKGTRMEIPQVGKFDTVINLNMGYYEIMLYEDIQKLFKIMIPRGKYQYWGLPMGMSIALY